VALLPTFVEKKSEVEMRLDAGTTNTSPLTRSKPLNHASLIVECVAHGLTDAVYWGGGGGGLRRGRGWGVVAAWAV
jgi:hypothetical protein